MLLSHPLPHTTWTKVPRIHGGNKHGRHSNSSTFLCTPQISNQLFSPVLMSEHLLSPFVFIACSKLLFLPSAKSFSFVTAYFLFTLVFPALWYTMFAAVLTYSYVWPPFWIKPWICSLVSNKLPAFTFCFLPTWWQLPAVCEFEHLCLFVGVAKCKWVVLGTCFALCDVCKYE